jgi:hypothetical protein
METIWKALETTTWKHPNHKIKLWDYQHCTGKKQLPDMSGSISTPLFKIWFHQISKSRRKEVDEEVG